MADRSKLDDLKDVLGGAARAIAHDPDVELAYTAEAPSQAGQHLKVPMPARDLPRAQVAEARGFADSFSLKLHHHDEATHRKNAPQEAVAPEDSPAAAADPPATSEFFRFLQDEVEPGVGIGGASVDGGASVSVAVSGAVMPRPGTAARRGGGRCARPSGGAS